MQELKTIKQIAEHFGVTTSGVRFWIKTKNIPYTIQKVIGIKPRMMLKIEDVEKALNLKSCATWIKGGIKCKDG